VNLDAFDTLVRVTLAGSAAILAVLIARRALRRRFGALVAYVAWTLVPAAVAAMLLPAPTHPVVALAGLVRVAPLQAASAAVVADALDPRIALFALWLAGALLAAAWFAQQQRRYLRSLGRLHAREGARIVQSDSEFAGPALVGAWRPRIVLPSDFDRRYDARERELILAHERVHFVRGDAWVNAFVVALRSLNWFNPLLHYAAAKFRIDQELACDAAVVARFPEARRQYADAMLKVQLAGQPRQELRLPVGCRWPSDQTLKERILMLKQSRPTRATRIVGFALVALLGLCGTYAAWATQAPRPPTTSGAKVDGAEWAVHLEIADGASAMSDRPTCSWSRAKASRRKFAMAKTTIGAASW
jgi:beta-lactamase regulating signal transducer with metallopeptidase domain